MRRGFRFEFAIIAGATTVAPMTPRIALSFVLSSSSSWYHRSCGGAATLLASIVTTTTVQQRQLAEARAVAAPVRHEPRRHMYLPKRPKPATMVDDMIITYRSNAIVVFLAIIVTISFIFVVCVQYLSNRFRDDETRTRKGKRVVIIGGSTAGSMVAAAITQLDSDVHVTVIDKSRLQTFTPIVPLAAAGHRSYDLRAKGPSSLFASTCWTVTREATLIVAEAKAIDPQRRVVLDDKGVEHPYDALVIAAGCDQDHALVGGKREMDTDRVAVHPGGIRDTLMSTATGNVLLVRAPAKEEANRSSEGTWVSMVNTCWKHLHFFGRTGAEGMSEVWAVTPDATVNDALPAAHREQLSAYWAERNIHVRTQWSLKHVDRRSQVATFVDAQSGKTHKVPFRMLVVDLPLLPPAFIASSPGNLAATNGFVDVDSTTLQHKRFPEIFSLGDCANLAVAKSYGAISAQAPVVSHNVMQVLRDRKPNASYDGYSSFHINMSTWRCMWPEVTGNHGQRVEPRRGYWDDSDWRGWKGFAQGVYVQMFAYEFMYWFCMLRAHWCAPHWFSWPVYEPGEQAAGATNAEATHAHVSR